MSNLLQWPIVILGLTLVGAGITVAWLKLIDLTLRVTRKRTRPR